MALSAKDKADIAEMIAAGNSNEEEEEVVEDGDVVILRGDVAKDFLAVMKGEEEPSGKKTTKKESPWAGFGKKYFGAEE